jgi:hypothetical protein
MENELQDDFEDQSAEELFLNYIRVIYQINPSESRLEFLIDALRDAFMAGLAIASVSEKDFKLELLLYANNIAQKAKRKLMVEKTQKGTVH